MTNGRHQSAKPSGDRDGRRAVWNRMMVVAAAVGLCLIGTGVALSTFSSPGRHAGRAAGAGSNSSAGVVPTLQPTPPVASSSTGPNITSAGIANSALRYPPDLNGQMVRWADGGGGAAWSAVTTQLGDVTQVGGAQLYSELRLECARLGSSVQTARSAPPIPDRAMERLYANVLARLAATSTDCRDAISVSAVGDEGQQITVDKALLNRSLAQFAAESGELYAATAEIRTLRR